MPLSVSRRTFPPLHLCYTVAKTVVTRAIGTEFPPPPRAAKNDKKGGSVTRCTHDYVSVHHPGIPMRSLTRNSASSRIFSRWPVRGWQCGNVGSKCLVLKAFLFANRLYPIGNVANIPTKRQTGSSRLCRPEKRRPPRPPAAFNPPSSLIRPPVAVGTRLANSYNKERPNRRRRGPRRTVRPHFFAENEARPSHGCETEGSLTGVHRE